MNGPCESCHLRPSSRVLTFGDSLEDVAFLVCDSCAETAEGYYGASTPIDDDTDQPATQLGGGS